MIQNGSTVDVHYTGKLTDGEVFDSSVGKSPLTFTVGSGSIIEGFEKAILGKNVGDKVTVQLAPQEAYGDYRDDLVVQVANTQLPGPVEVGQILSTVTENGQINVVVKEVHPEHAIIDGNHPFAGKDLIFEIEVVNVN